MYQSEKNLTEVSLALDEDVGEGKVKQRNNDGTQRRMKCVTADLLQP